MAVQTSYGYFVDRGAPGTLYDNAPHEVLSRRSEEDDGAIKYGVGVVTGTTKGVQVKLPDTDSSLLSFEGVVIDGYTDEMNKKGEVVIRNDATVGCVRHGNVWVRLADGVEPAYGDAVYLITDGDEAGYFTNDADGGLKIDYARFIGSKGTGATAPIAL